MNTTATELEVAIQAFYAMWNKTAETSKSPDGLGLIAAKGLTSKRHAKIARRLHEHPPDEWLVIFAKCGASSFMCGSNKNRWRASLDWIIENEDNALKVLEGKYDTIRPGAAAQQTQYQELRDSAE